MILPDYPELFVLRHGQTTWNLQGRLQGRRNTFTRHFTEFTPLAAPGGAGTIGAEIASSQASSPSMLRLRLRRAHSVL